MEKLSLMSSVTGIIMFLVGVFINYRIAKSRFYRRAITGVELFRSFSHFWFTRLLEKIGRLIAIVLIIAGLMLTIGSFLVPGSISWG